MNRSVITSGSTQGIDFVFCAGEFLMASKEVLRRMQLVRFRLLLCVEEYIFWEWSILTEAQPDSRTGAVAEE